MPATQERADDGESQEQDYVPTTAASAVSPHASRASSNTARSAARDPGYGVADSGGRGCGGGKRALKARRPTRPKTGLCRQVSTRTLPESPRQDGCRTDENPNLVATQDPAGDATGGVQAEEEIHLAAPRRGLMVHAEDRPQIPFLPSLHQ